MEDTVILAENLRQEWKELSAEVKKSKKLKSEKFDAVFSQTYTLLSKYLAESTLDKKCVELVAEAFLFANIKDETLDNLCLAAFVLTERMLTYCGFNSAPTCVEGATIYVAELRKEVPLNFNDVEDSVSKLAKIFDDIYWKKVNA